MATILFAGACCAAQLQPSSEPLTGTINVVLANANGIVVLTDSNQTGTDQGRLSPAGEAQKLFQLDEQTVCTIAGFSSIQLRSFPEYINSAAARLDRYAEALRKGDRTGYSFDDKLADLEFAFKLYLASVTNLQKLSPDQTGPYGFELLLAGYDLDGSARIAKLVMKVELSSGVPVPVVTEPPRERTVGRELIHESAGIGEHVAENILGYPGQLAEEPEIGRYKSSKESSEGGSLTTAEMKSLASSIARHAALADRVLDPSKLYARQPGGLLACAVRGRCGARPSPFVYLVGGHSQIAVLRNGKIEVEQRTFPPRPRSKPIQLNSEFDYDGKGRALLSRPDSNVTRVFAHGTFRHGTVMLDDTYYFADTFEDCLVIYDGGVLDFENNRVINSRLVVGGRANRKSPPVRDLISKYPWARVSP